MTASITAGQAVSELHKFLFEGVPVRGMLVKLTDGWQEVLRRRASSGEPFPPSVRTMVGEMTAAAVLMQANLQFNGSLTLQIHGDGPVKIAVVEVQPDLAFRATAKVVGEAPDDARLEALVNANGQGRCAITLDPKERLPGHQPYQGVVALHGDQREPLQDLSAVLDHYMLQSEQLDTRLVLAANEEVAAGLLIQRMPVAGEGNLAGTRSNEDDIGINEAFNRISHLAATLTADELLNLGVEKILHRLFWEETMRRFVPTEDDPVPRFACTCSRERVGRMLLNLGREEADGIVVEQGRVEIGCDFCGVKYHFDAVDVGELFTPPRDQPPGTKTLN